jgi:hypothetical protein
MITRELEAWGVVLRVPVAGGATRFAAETDLMRMIGGVLARREAALVRQVHDDLRRAAGLAAAEGAPVDARRRVEKMAALARLVDGALSAFLRTARLDVADAAHALERQ